MSPFELFNLFVRPPGDLLYFLIVIVITLAGGLMAFGHRMRRPDNRTVQRYSVGALGAVTAFVVLMIGALYALFARESTVDILPPLERAASVTALVLLGWAFLTADHDQWRGISNVVALLLLLLIVAGYVITGWQWPQLSSTVDFNLSVFGVAWSFVPLILAVVGIMLCLVNFRIIVDAPLKLVFFLLIALGSGFTLLQITQGTIIGDYAGAARVALFIALPILPAVIYRAILRQMDAEIATAAANAARARAPTPPVRPPASAAKEESPVERQSALLLKSLGVILTDATPANVPQRIVDAALEALKADVGALLRMQDANYADITCGTDRVMKRQIPAIALNLDQQPTLVNAVERQAQRGLFTDRNTKELDDLYTRLDISQRGPVYMQPLVHDKQIVAVLMICLPYTGRELRDYEQELLKGLAVISSSLLALSYAANDARRRAEERVIQAMVEGVTPDEVQDEDVLTARREMEATLKAATEQIAQLSRQVMELKIELDYERGRMAKALEDTDGGSAITERMAAISEEQEKLREERDRLATRLQEAEAALAGATSSGDLNPMIAALEREKTELEAQRLALQGELDNLRANDRLVVPGSLQEIINSMTAEKARLEAERDQLHDQLDDLETQLKALGIEDGPRGLAQLLGQLYEQRASMEAKYSAFKRERDMLLAERAKAEGGITQAQERQARIETLENEIRNLASDRETLTKQRDQLRSERDEMRGAEDRWKMQRARLLAQIDEYRQELEDAHAEQGKLRAEVQEYADERSRLAKERDGLLADRTMLTSERSMLYARIEGDRERLESLEKEGVGSLTKMVEELSTQRDQLERDLNEARTRLAALDNKVQALEIAHPAEQNGAHLAPLENPELLMGLVQELRTPMTSIVGYVDLLLNESVGILGDGQRKVMQRVLANVMRLASMLEDLIRLTALDTGNFALMPELVNVVNLIEDSITNAAIQFREKGLTVHLNLDDRLPPLRADRDALNQIIGQLLTNAYLVSPPESEVYIRAERYAHAADKMLHLSVEDRGGGVDPADEARVFSRKYKAENPLIQGIGDTGVGLSIAKALVEAHGGKLWLESHPNVGNIFNVLLPLEPVLER